MDKMETSIVMENGSKADSSKKKRKRKSKKLENLSSKTALQILNDNFGPNIEYTYTQEGSTHQPAYLVTAPINLELFRGNGSSKALARKDLATKAIEKLLGVVLPPASGEPAVFSDNLKPSYNFTKGSISKSVKDVEMADCTQNFGDRKSLNGTHQPSGFLPVSGINNLPPINHAKARSQPLQALSEFFPRLHLEWVDGTGNGARHYKVESEVLGRRFFGEGRSKKMAKQSLAKTIFTCMYDISDYEESEPPAKKRKSEKKYPYAQLKDLVGADNLTLETVKLDTVDESEDKFHVTIVVKGVAYEAVGKTQESAKVRASKKALDVLAPKKVHTAVLDTSQHPLFNFYQLYGKDYNFIESEEKDANGKSEFCIQVEIKKRVFKAKGPNKRKAKIRLILDVFKGLRKVPYTDWTCLDIKEVFKDTSPEKKVESPPQSAAMHPINLLIKLCPQVQFHLSEDDSSGPACRYKAIAQLGGASYEGTGVGKRSAKTASACAALLHKYGIDPDRYTDSLMFHSKSEPKSELPSNLSQLVAKAVEEKYFNIFQDESHPKVMAAFVLAKYDEPDSEPLLEVISIGTGTKCISGVNMSNEGQTLNDCHAEIIAARGFRQFLFDELLLAVQKSPETVFERMPDGKFAMKDDIKVFVFINTAPCGDGRVFTLRNDEVKSVRVGCLRTKIENGQGTIPVPENKVQTVFGIMDGERLRTMSCSDKVLKWNVLGVQGALLTHFIKPVYIYGMVIGLQYNYVDLYRALYKRAHKVPALPDSYHVNKCLFGSVGKLDRCKDSSKSLSHSFNWHYRRDTVEAIDPNIGQTFVNAPSRLCKLEFFHKFIEVLKVGKLKMRPQTYLAAKSMASEYQIAKKLFSDALVDANVGNWVGKPKEHDMFGC